MEPADDFHWIKDGPEGAVAFWQGYDPEVKVVLSSCALKIGEALVFIDPVPLAEPALSRLTGGRAPAGILLTNANHERAAASLAGRFQAPIHAHVGTVPELSLLPHHHFGDGALLFGALAALTLPGGGPGETAFYWKGRKALVMGDALIHLPKTGLAPLPEKYCTDAPQLRRSLKKLACLAVETVLFAHGEPLVENAAARLETVLG